MQPLFSGSHAFRVEWGANTGVQSKQNLKERFWKFHVFNEEKGMLCKFHNYVFVVYKLLGCVLTFEMQG
jgi:hypothetical protein